MAGMMSEASSCRNHGIVANSLNTGITSALQTGNERIPVLTLVRPRGWAKEFEPAATFLFDTGPCL